MGGHANIYWDSLVAQITFKDAAGLGRILGALGLKETPKADQKHINVGFLPVDDFSVYVTVTFVPPVPGEAARVTLTLWLEALPSGASIGEFRRAQRVEALLEAAEVEPSQGRP